MMEKQKQLCPVVICTRPKTVLYIDNRLSEKEKRLKISRYIDKHGNLKMETVPEYSIYG